MIHSIGCRDKIFPWHLHPSQMYEMALELGISKRDLLSAVKLNEEKIEDLELQIAWSQYRAMAELLNHYGPADWSFQFGNRLTLASHGIISLAIMNCSSWRQILEILTKYKNLVTSLFFLDLEYTDTHLLMTIRPEFTREDITFKFVEIFTTVFYRSLYHITTFKELMEDNQDNICVFIKGEQPEYYKDMHEVFHNNIRWGHYAHQIRFNISLLDRDMAFSNTVAAKNMIKMLTAQLTLLPNHRGVLRELYYLFEKGLYRQEECAKHLFASVSTLKRSIAKASTTFSEELAIYRMEKACYLLGNTDINIVQLSDLLGFQDSDSFRKLFKKKLGISPSNFKEKILKKKY